MPMRSGLYGFARGTQYILAVIYRPPLNARRENAPVSRWRETIPCLSNGGI